ncbi:MAG: DNA primase [Microgenomates group bacterium]
MDNQIEEIKRKIDIVDFIGSFINLKKTGRNYKAICPFHQEKTPSFIVSPERQIWHCFGACSEGGDIFKFLMKWENITFVEALKELAKKAGVALKKIDFQDKVWQKRERYFSMNFFAAEFFHYLLTKNRFGEKALLYLKSRGIKDSTIKLFQLGYAPVSWDSLKNFLKSKKFAEEEMLENGLLIKGEKGNFYDRFRGRLIFPLKDSRGNIVGFSGRILDESKKEAKYVNSPETPIYHKRETLFGIHLAKDSIKTEKNVFIVEGEFDMITPYQNGFSNFVAIKGTALTNEQLLLLKRYTEKITLVLDADSAGEQSTLRAIDEAERLDLEIEIVRLSKGKDPDEAVRSDLKAFKEDLKKSLPIYDFLIETAQKKYPEETSFAKKKIADEVLPFIERILNPIVRSYYVKKIAKILAVEEKSIEAMLAIIKKTKKTKINFTQRTRQISNQEREIIIEKYLLSYLFQTDNLTIKKKIIEILTPEDFKIPSFQKLFSLFLPEIDSFTVEGFVKKLTPELKEVFDEIFLYASFNEEIKEKDIEKIIFEIKKYSLKRQIANLLKKDEDEEKEKSLIKLTQLLKEVEKKIN